MFSDLTTFNFLGLGALISKVELLFSLDFIFAKPVIELPPFRFDFGEVGLFDVELLDIPGNISSSCLRLCFATSAFSIRSTAWMIRAILRALRSARSFLSCCSSISGRPANLLPFSTSKRRAVSLTRNSRSCCCSSFVLSINLSARATPSPGKTCKRTNLFLFKLGQTEIYVFSNKSQECLLSLVCVNIFISMYMYLVALFQKLHPKNRGILMLFQCHCRCDGGFLER